MKYCIHKPLLKLNNILYKVFFLLTIFSSQLSWSQTDIGGVINEYRAVTAITNPGCSTCDNSPGCLNEITVTDSSPFSVGDKVLIVQLKGATVDQSNTPAGGYITDIGNAGNYEFFDVGTITGNIVSPIAPLKRIYDGAGQIQLVRVPTYPDDVNIVTTLLSSPWDPINGTGGVVALFVQGTVTMNANIDVRGAGYVGQEMSLNGLPDNCSLDPNLQYNLPITDSSSWFKGGGVAQVTPATSKGRAPLGNGGGSGVSGDSGGGGGGNFGAGGIGGSRWCNELIAEGGIVTTNGIIAGGLGGEGLGSLITGDNRVFFGGAGGPGYVTTGNPSRASDGGGIVIIRALNFVGNGFTIDASGVDATRINPTGFPDGGGGGGAGGSVAFDILTYTGTVNINLTGGDGQSLNTTDIHGPGGGGGGGVFLHNLFALPPSILLDAAGGDAGTHTGVESTNANGAMNGQNGGVLNYFNLIETADTDNFYGNGDGIPDKCDLDSDNDGILDTEEDGGTGFDPSQDADGDGLPNYLDKDDATPGFPPFVSDNGDGVNDVYDKDRDAIPDFHDLDSDNDGITDVIESGGIDANGDGFADGPVGTTPTTLGIPSSAGTGTVPRNSDTDAFPDHLDIDADADGIPDNIEAQTTLGYIPISGIGLGMDDNNGNGVDDNYENGALVGISPVNTDNLNLPDYLALDTDNDSLNDIIEGWDLNADGIPETLPTNTDADEDGLDDAFDNNDTALIPDNGTLPTNFPDAQTPGGDLDWRQAPLSSIDTDGDGVLDAQEILDGTDPNDPCDFVIANITQPQAGDYLVVDCDGDGVTNGQEITDGTSPEDPCDFLNQSVTLQPSGDYLIADCDGDGVINGTEITDGTDPEDPCDFLDTSVTLEKSGLFLITDCDKDTINNGQEIIDGTDPFDACSSKGGTPPSGTVCDIIIDNELVGPQIDEGFFRIINIEAFPDNTVSIYNRWGVLVFKTKGYINGNNAFRGISDGRATINKQKELPVGIYYYVVEYVNNGEAKVKSGYLYVNR